MKSTCLGGIQVLNTVIWLKVLVFYFSLNLLIYNFLAKKILSHSCFMEFGLCLTVWFIWNVKIFHESKLSTKNNLLLKAFEAKIHTFFVIWKKCVNHVHSNHSEYSTQCPVFTLSHSEKIGISAKTQKKVPKGRAPHCT